MLPALWTLSAAQTQRAASLAPCYPEFLGGNNAAAGDDPAARLFDLLATPCKPLPTAEQLAQQAAEVVLSAKPHVENEHVPF